MTEIEQQQALDTLFRIADYARIAHHITGRIRIKFTLAAKSGLADIDLEKLTEKLAGIHHYRLNNKNGSIVIEYDPNIIPEIFWEKLVNSPLEKRSEVTMELLTLWDNG